ncbi:MAG: DUF4304 domain-containing protein [Actinobacteria bacterium]|nr:DUF4304 domain-containing protein [Actinomycetota bacterium]
MEDIKKELDKIAEEFNRQELKELTDIRRSVRKLIKKVFKPFADEHGFKFHKPTLLLREYKDTLHIISFELSTADFTCRIAILPLYVPEDTISLSFGNRISRFKVMLREWWDYKQTEQENEQSLMQIKELLERNALPWFEEAGSPEGIVSFIESGKADDPSIALRCPRFIKDLYLGFSYLYLNKYDQAGRLLQAVADSFKGDTRQWAINTRELAENMCTLAKERPEEVSIKLQEFIKQTKENLKLKSYR